MGEHPIIFSTEMVRAILDGRKTKSRRIIMPQPEDEDGYRFWWKGDWDTRGGPRAGVCTHGSPGNGEATWTLKEIAEYCSYGQVGDRLWVRETWGSLDADHPRCKDGRKPKQGDRLVYRANPADDYQWGAGKPSQGSFCWRPSIHMFRWAARIFLEITNIRVERVQDISLKDVISEGIKDTNKCVYNDDNVFKCNHHDTLDKFKNLWDSLNAKRGYSWDKNPWCWVIEFKRKEKP